MDEGSYCVDYDDLHNLGKSLVRSGDVDGGIGVLELAAHEFPKMPMVFRSLGMAYVTKGEDKPALECYDKSLALNPRRNSREVSAYVEVVLERTLLEDGFAAMARQYDELRNQYRREVSESLLNSIGYHLMGAKRHEAAIDVLSLNVEKYPEYANGYDSLGEAYMSIGEKKPAIESYEKALELAPDNENAREMLKKLREQ
jgi:tetratricopeptide (TPR) repeat protein